jgi:hypothetical protein
MKPNKSLKEIKIQPIGAATLSPDILAAIKDDVISYITDELNGTIYNLLDYYFDSYVIDTFESFIIDQMIFNNHSITRNGKEILMSHNTNRDLITEEDIREYIDGNPSLQKYLKDIIYKFYIKHVDVECLTKASIIQAIKDKQESERYGEEYSTRNVSNSVGRVFWNSDCDSTYIGDILYGEDFNLFLQQEFKQADVIEEIKVQPSYTFGDNPKTLNGIAKVETDMFGKGYTLALVDLGSHYTFIPYSDQPFVVLIPKQYIEPLEKEYYPISQDGVQQLKDLLRQGKIEKVKSIEQANGVVGKIKEVLKKKILREYPESTITKLLTKWGIDPEKDQAKANIARGLITRFEQIKASLEQKLDILTIPDEIKSKDIKNIELYSFDDLEKLVRSYPESLEKIKKEAIKKFVDKEGINQATAQSYTARFMAKRDDLRYGARNGLEDLGFTKEEILNFIPKRLQQNEAFLDPRNWGWQAFEQMLDAVFPSQKKAEGGENIAETDADKVYDKDGLEIYKGDDVHKCISYNPITSTGRKKYGWCVTQVGNTNYDFYRFGGGVLQSPTFYIVFDRSKDSSPEYAPFKDQWHAFVIQTEFDQSKYVVTGANNRGDIPVESWDAISKIVPADTWAKIKNLKQYFKPIALSNAERARKMAAGKKLSLDEFKELSQDDKILYIQGRAQKNEITSDILQILPQYKIDVGGRSTTLANIAIDSGQTIPFSILKNYESLAKRYAIFRFRHTNYGKTPIPLPYVKYLDEPAKEKYLETFDGNLTFQYIEKYFGENAARNYVNEQAKDLKFLPVEAIKYIQDPKIKQLYGLYAKLLKPWQYGYNTNISEEDLEKEKSMPEQSISPIPLNKDQWAELSSAERKAILDLTEKFNGKSEYLDLLFALPVIVKDGNNRYAVLPENTDDPNTYVIGNWTLADENGNVVKNNIPGTSTVGDLYLSNWYPDDSNKYKKVYNINDLKVA